MSILTTHTDLVSAMFANLNRAENVVTELYAAGVPRDDISLISGDTSEAKKNRPELQGLYLEQEDSPVEDGTQTGAVVGGTGGFLAGLTAVSIPGVGPFLVLGTALVTAIAGLSVGALAGGAVGILIELGYRKDLAERISDSLKRGHVLVAARAESMDREKIRNLMLKHQPEEIMEKQTV